MDPDLMRLNDFIEMEKEKTRHAAQHTIAFIVLTALEKEDGPNLEKLKQGMREIIARSEAFRAEMRKLEEQI